MLGINVAGLVLAIHQTPLAAEEERQLREMAEAGKSVKMIGLELKRTVSAVRGRLGILKISIRGDKTKRTPPA